MANTRFNEERLEILNELHADWDEIYESVGDSKELILWQKKLILGLVGKQLVKVKKEILVLEAK